MSQTDRNETFSTAFADLNLKPIDTRSSDELSDLAAMHTSYLFEEFERIGRVADGFPIASFLTTLFIQWQGELSGFVAVDLKRYAVELIYLKPPYRGQNIGLITLLTLAQSCPQPMALKAPLTPAAQALSDRLRLRVTHTEPEKVAEAQAFLEKVSRIMKKKCTHKRQGNPLKPCKPCYRRLMRRYSVNLVQNATGVEVSSAP